MWPPDSRQTTANLWFFSNTKAIQNWRKLGKPSKLPMEHKILHIHLDSAILPSSKLFSKAVWPFFFFLVLNHRSVVKTVTSTMSCLSKSVKKESHANFHTCLFVPALHARLTELAWPHGPTAPCRVKRGVGGEWKWTAVTQQPLSANLKQPKIGPQRWASIPHSAAKGETHHMASASLGCTPLFQINDS